MATTLKQHVKRLLRRLGVLPKRTYWDRRKHLRYTRYVQELIRIVEQDARSAIDVGAWNTPVVEDFDWIPDRSALDLRIAYSSPNVKGIVADFFEYDPPRHYDLRFVPPGAGAYSRR